MKSYRKELWFNLPTRRGFVNITPDVEVAVRESGIKEGFVLVNAMHISASVFINDDESGLHHDYEKWLEKLAPNGWKNLPLTNQSANTATTTQAKTTPTRTSNAKSWDAKLSSQSPTANWTSARGNRSSTASSTAGEESASS